MADAFLEVRPSNTAAIRLYLALGFEDQANKSYEFNIKRSLRDYTTLALQNRGTR